MPQGYDCLCGAETIYFATEFNLEPKLSVENDLPSGGIDKRFCIFYEEIFHNTVRVHL